MMANRYNKKTGRFKSKLEHFVWTGLKKLCKGLNLTYETVKLPYTIDHVYLPDFIVRFPNGRVLYLEAKGRFTSTDRRKIKAVKQAHPDIDLRFIFSRDDPLYKGSKTRYSDWCKKLDIPYVVGTGVPKKWIEDKDECTSSL